MVRAELGLFSKSKPDVTESLISGTSQKLPFLCYYHIFSSYIFKWIIFHWCWVGFVYCQKIHQLLYRTGGLQERVTEYLGLFRFVLHSEYYSTELEFFFFFGPLSQLLAKLVPSSILDQHALSAHLSSSLFVRFALISGPDKINIQFFHVLALTDITFFIFFWL